MVIVALDFETANHEAHSACQLGLVRLEGWSLGGSASWMIRPPDDYFAFTHIHGICWEDVMDSPSFAELWPEITPHLKGADFLAAHNAPFDRKVLQSTCAHHGLEAPAIPFLDTVQVARKTWQIFPTKLNLVCQKLGIELNHHEALSDAKACAEILRRAVAAGWEP